jgi:4-hydroxy-tetrahydrodipicolinate reductase
MTRIILAGACGKMGKVVQSVINNRENCEIVAGVDKFNDNSAPFPVYEKISEVKEEADVIIDFSNPSLLDDLLDYAKTNKTALVIATTGYDECQKKKIADASKETAIFFTYNMSIGINLLASLAKKAVAVLGNDFDIEIIEEHHNQKIDAPSGTALMLADAISEEFDESMKYEYDRHSKREKRTKNEIGIHSIRGGTIVGEHRILFAGRDENISLSHSARSKEVFAVGAVNAALFMKDKTPGMYDMGELVK